MHNLIEQLTARGPVITDGAWGTEFQKRGLAAGEIPESWNLSHPDRVEAAARAYVEAGSQIILTNTFRANRLALAHSPYAAQSADINRLGVEISRRAAASRALVFASLGPSGKLLMMGEVTADQLRVAYYEQASVLAAAGADALLFETMSDLEEAKIGVEAARATGLPIVVSMAFDSGKNHDRTMMGVTPEQAAKELEAAGADVVGANCGQGIETYAPLGQRLRAATTLPIWLKPNAGLPELVDGKTQYRTASDEFVRHVPALLSAGVNFLGGCCGTSPEFIHALAAKLHGKRAEQA